MNDQQLQKDKMEEDLIEVKKLISSVLVSSPTAMSVAKLDKDYFELIGERVPFKNFGYKTLESFLHSIPDVLEVRGTGINAEIVVHISSNVAHLDKLISKQRMPVVKNRYKILKRKTTKQSYTNTSSHSNGNLNFIYPIDNARIPISNSPQGNYSSFSCTNSLPIHFESINQNKPPFKTDSLSSNEKTQVTNFSGGNLPNQQSFSKSPFDCSSRQVMNVLPAGYTPCNQKPFSNTFPSKHKRPSKRFNVPPHVNLSPTNSNWKPSGSTAHGAIPKNAHTKTETTNGNCQPEVVHNPASKNTIFGIIPFKNSDNVPRNVQIRLETLIDRFAKGIWCAKLPEMYMDMFDKELDYTEYGYRSLISMCFDLKETFICIRPGKADFKLFSTKKPLPDECYMKFDDKTTSKKNIEELSPQLPNEPAVIDVEELRYIKEVAVYPTNVVHPSVTLRRQFLPHDVQTNDFIKVMVGEIYDPSKFWILLREQYSELCILMSDLQSYYTCNDVNLLIPKHMLVPNLYCVAKYNNEYSRAMIRDNMKTLNEYYHVFYIDYGTVATVHFSEIYYLNEQFAYLPHQGIRARLANIYPVNKNTQWSTEAASRFLNLVYEKNLFAQIARIDYKEEIIDLFLADTSSGKDVYINDTLVWEGYALFTNKEQQPVETDVNYVPCVKYIHLFPTFFEIENAIVVSGTKTSILEEIGISLEEMYPQYFIKCDKVNCKNQDECKEMKNSPSHLNENGANEHHTPRSPSNNSSSFNNISTSLPIVPTSSIPPGFERLHASQSIINNAAIQNYPIQMMNVQSFMQYNFPQYQQFNLPTWNQFIPNYPFYQFNYWQFYQQQIPLVYQGYKEPITVNEPIRLEKQLLDLEEITKIDEIPEISINYDEEELLQAINKIINQLLLGNKELFLYLVEELRKCESEIEDFCHTIVNVLIIHKFAVYKQLIDRLTDRQIIELDQKEIELTICRKRRLSNSINEVHKTDITEELSESFENLNCSSSETNYIINTDNENDINLTQKIELQHNKNKSLVYPIDLFDQIIHIIRMEDEIYAIVSEIVQFTEHPDPIEKIRKLIVMIDPPYTITDLSLKDHQELYKELCDYRHYKDDSILHIIPAIYVPEMIDNLDCIYLDPNYDKFLKIINNLRNIKQY